MTGRRSRTFLMLRARLAAMALLVPLALLVAMASATPVDAHALLVRATPGQGESLAAPPTEAQLWFSEDVIGNNGTLKVTLRTPDNHSIPATSVTLDPNDAKHVIAKLPGLGFETYTLVWQNQSATDGHIISGSYTFRIGGGPTPGASTTDGGAPAIWAVITRWLTFFGLATGAGGFFVARFLLAPFGWGDERQRAMQLRGGQAAPVMVRRLSLVGLVVAVVATLSEIPLQWQFPPAGTEQASFANVLRGLPRDWWFRPISGAVAAVLALAWLGLARFGRLPAMSPATGIVAGGARLAPGQKRPAGRSAPANPPLEWFGLIASLVALLGLALTGHSAAQSGFWLVPALVSNVLHEVAAALWAGGLVMLAVARWSAPREGAPSIDPVRRFSPIAFGLFGVAGLTGIANAGIILPSVASLWDSRYGVTILVKTALVLVALGLAATNRRRVGPAVASAAAWTTGRLRESVRLETIVVTLVLIAAATLALSAPPVSGALTQNPALTKLQLMEQVTDRQGAVIGLMTLTADPLRAGETNHFTVSYADPNNAPVPIPVNSRVFLQMSSVLDGNITQPRLELQADVGPISTPTGTPASTPTGTPASTPTEAPTGTFSGSGNQLSTDSWWQITATIREVGKEDRATDFYVLLPDPNMYGNDAVKIPKSDPDAETLYHKAFDQATKQTSLQDHQSITTGLGGSVYYDETIATGPSPDANTYQNSLQSYGAPGQPPTSSMTRRIGANMWSSADGGKTWTSLFSPDPALSPADVMDQYDGATGFQLGRQMIVNGELSQALIFTVPASQYAVTRYVWWIGTQSGQRNEELMITGGHYMIKPFTAYNTNPVITAPDPATVVNPSS